MGDSTVRIGRDVIIGFKNWGSTNPGQNSEEASNINNFLCHVCFLKEYLSELHSLCQPE